MRQGARRGVRSCSARATEASLRETHILAASPLSAREAELSVGVWTRCAPRAGGLDSRDVVPSAHRAEHPSASTPRHRVTRRGGVRERSHVGAGTSTRAEAQDVSYAPGGSPRERRCPADQRLASAFPAPALACLARLLGALLFLQDCETGRAGEWGGGLARVCCGNRAQPILTAALAAAVHVAPSGLGSGALIGRHVRVRARAWPSAVAGLRKWPVKHCPCSPVARR